MGWKTIWERSQNYDHRPQNLRGDEMNEAIAVICIFMIGFLLGIDAGVEIQRRGLVKPERKDEI